MSSKTHRGESSKPSSKHAKQYDKKQFVNEATSERYHTVLAGKALIPKRGLRPYETQSGQLAIMIIDKGSLEFTKQSEVAVVSIMK